MKKLQSSLVNMVLVLGITTALAGLLLSAVNSATSEARETTSREKLVNALRSVVGDYDISPDNHYAINLPGGATAAVYPATDADGNIVAGAVETSSSNAFNGTVTIVTGFSADGTILGYEVTNHAETPGLGAKMNDWFRNQGNIIGRETAMQLKVSKDGGDVDGITAATISSRAFLEAINAGAEAWRIFLMQHE